MDRHPSGAGVGTTPFVSVIEGVSTALLLCRKNLGIYPLGHPRLDVSLRALRARLAECEENEGVPFHFDTEWVLGENDGKDGAHTRQDRFTLARVLQLRLVRTLTIHARASDDELLGLASVLHDDFFKSASGRGANADPGTWEDIELAFYEAQELPAGCSPVMAVLERAAGIRRHEELEPLLAGLPEPVLRRLQEHLARPEFLHRISRLRAALRAIVTVAERKEASKLDLVSESLRVTLAANGGEEAPADRLIRDLDHFLSFAEKHVEFLATDARSAPDGVGSADPTSAVRSLDPESTSLATGALIQTLKERMSFLFRTAKGPAAPGRDGSDDGDAEHRQRASRDDDAAGREIAFPTDARLPRIGRLAPAANEVLVVLELLRRQVAGFAPRWDALEERLLASVRKDEQAEEVTVRLVEFLAKEPLRQARKLFFALLAGFDTPQAVVAAFERLGDHLHAAECIDDYLGWLIATTPRRGIEVIIALRKSDVARLHTLAGDRLLQLGGDPELLMTWLVSDPDCVRSDVGRQYLLGLSPENLRAAFKLFFTSASSSQIASFLAHLPADLPGVEHVLLAAVDYASSLHRRIALRQLAAFPSPASVKSLAEIVKLNNLREKPDLEDTKAALIGLAGMDSDGARAFLHEIFDRRKGFVRYYSRAVRGLLREVLEQREAKRCP